MDGTSEINISLEDINNSTEVDESGKNWYEQSYWKNKGEPKERRTITVAGEEVGIVNFNESINFEDFEGRTKTTLKDFVNRFPEASGKLKWILIRDFQPEPLHEGFPSNGITLKIPERTMVLEPRAFEDISHRIEGVPNFEGTLVHEMGHQIEEKFFPEWIKFWPMSADDPDNWIPDKTGKNFPVHKVTGQKATTPEGRYLADQRIVNKYAEISMGEDISESMVAHVFKPERLEEISRERAEILRGHDHLPQVA